MCCVSVGICQSVSVGLCVHASCVCNLSGVSGVNVCVHVYVQACVGMCV